MRGRWIFLAMLPALAACITQRPQAVAPATSACEQTGMASWYHAKVAPTAEGGTASQLSAAHNTLPFGTQVKVTNLSNGKSVVVRIDDRGPVAKDRIIDLSAPAATELGIRQDGVAQVKLGLAPVDRGAAAPASCPFDQNKPI